MNLNSFSSIGINHPTITPTSPNYFLPSWPPPPDFPIVVDVNGKVITVYSDTSWDLSIWEGKSLHLNFGDTNGHSQSAPVLTKSNADTLRKICAFWLWGPNPSISAASLKRRFTILFPLFSLCSNNDIHAECLSRFPKVEDKACKTFTSASAETALNLLHDLFERRELLGFTILDREGLRRLAYALPDHNSNQTAYIPPRIWGYQIHRLREVINDYLEHRENIEQCFVYCLNKYQAWTDQYHGPFNSYKRQESFHKIAERYKIDGLLSKWILSPGETLQSKTRGISTLSSYLTLTSKAALCYILNFSLMRIDEGWDLRSDCLTEEIDETFGSFYLLSGETTKTIEDDDARWVTGPSTSGAVMAMSSIARLRVNCAISRNIELPADEISNPYLITRNLEPWSKSKVTERVNLRPIYGSYRQIVRDYPNLFDIEQIKITQEDLIISKSITPSIDSDKFILGAPWPFCWHQLRRTGAVNMQASGIVSDPSLQYQLKHPSRSQTLYYGQGYSRVHLNDKARTEYLTVMYRIIGLEISQLLAGRYISPYGQKHKENLLRLVTESDNNKLVTAAKKGLVSWHATLLGGCCFRGNCTYGGVDNLIRCAGGDGDTPCTHALYDEFKSPLIKELQQELKSKLGSVAPDAPYYESLQAQIKATENALNVIYKSSK